MRTINSEQDWYDQQQLGITNGTVYWNSIAPKPTASAYVTDRDGKNDGIHVVVVDDNGEVTGIKGNVLEKHLDLSKALDAVSAARAPLKTYYKITSQISPSTFLLDSTHLFLVMLSKEPNHKFLDSRPLTPNPLSLTDLGDVRHKVIPSMFWVT